MIKKITFIVKRENVYVSGCFRGALVFIANNLTKILNGFFEDLKLLLFIDCFPIKYFLLCMYFYIEFDAYLESSHMCADKHTSDWLIVLAKYIYIYI